MRRYETIFIADPDLTAEERYQLFEKTKNLIENQNGFVGIFDEWGNKRLAYDIKKKSRGHYVLVDYCGNGTLVDELERTFKIDDNVLKYMTIVLNKHIELEQYKEELSNLQQERQAEEQSDETKQYVPEMPDDTTIAAEEIQTQSESEE